MLLLLRFMYPFSLLFSSSIRECTVSAGVTMYVAYATSDALDNSPSSVSKSGG